MKKNIKTLIEENGFITVFKNIYNDYKDVVKMRAKLQREMSIINKNEKDIKEQAMQYLKIANQMGKCQIIGTKIIAQKIEDQSILSFEYDESCPSHGIEIRTTNLITINGK